MAGYGDDAGFADWLSENGHVLPGAAAAPAVLRQRASTYLDARFGPRFSGSPTGGFAQDRAWPRTGASGHGAAIPDDLVPTPIVRASYAAAWREAVTPGLLSAVAVPGRQVKREKVEGAVEREFFEGDGEASNGAPALSEVEGLVAPFLTLAAPAVFVV